MLHFGLLGSSQLNFFYTAAAIGVAASLLWLAPWSQAESSREVVTQLELEYKPLDQQSAAQLKSAHSSVTGSYKVPDHRTLSALSALPPASDAPSATQTREKGPRRSFSFHYLDILEWLFARKPDPNNVTQPRPTTGNLRH